MKRITWIVAAACMVFAMCGCASQSELDAVTAERDALQERCDALQAALDQHSAIIAAVEAEEYDAAMEIISEKKIAKEVAQKGEIDAYLVTVELSLDNFSDYFEWTNGYRPDDFGEPKEHDLYCQLSSKVYDEGLILYKADVRIGYTLNVTSMYQDSREWNDEIHQTAELKEGFLTQSGCSSSEGTRFILEKSYVDTTRVEGTVTFVKAEYVTGYELSDVRNGYHQDAEITLVNGERLYRTVVFGDKF